MSGTDYTQTPSLGLYKPIANRAVGTWGDLWNANADVLDSSIHFASGGGPFLPLAGGNVFGPVRLSGLPNAQPDGSPPVGAVSGDLYINGGFVCIKP